MQNSDKIIELSKAFEYYHRHEEDDGVTEGVTWREVRPYQGGQYIVKGFFQQPDGEITEANISNNGTAPIFNSQTEAEKNIRAFEKAYESNGYDVAENHPRKVLA